MVVYEKDHGCYTTVVVLPLLLATRVFRQRIYNHGCGYNRGRIWKRPQLLYNRGCFTVVVSNTRFLTTHIQPRFWIKPWLYVQISTKTTGFGQPWSFERCCFLYIKTPKSCFSSLSAKFFRKPRRFNTVPFISPPPLAYWTADSTPLSSPSNTELLHITVKRFAAGHSTALRSGRRPLTSWGEFVQYILSF